MPKILCTDNEQLAKGLLFIEKAAPKCIETAWSAFLDNPPAVLLAGRHNVNVGRTSTCIYACLCGNTFPNLFFISAIELSKEAIIIS